MNFQILSAQTDDAQAISELLEIFAQRKIVLSRSTADILLHLKNFIVAKDADSGELVGSVALREFNDGLNEIRSLAVKESLQGHGLGRKLVKAALELAQKRQATNVFALTLRPDFFQHNGFEITEMNQFPEKVWADCRHCPKRGCCDEIAVKFIKDSQIND